MRLPALSAAADSLQDDGVNSCARPHTHLSTLPTKIQHAPTSVMTFPCKPIPDCTGHRVLGTGLCPIQLIILVRWTEHLDVLLSDANAASALKFSSASPSHASPGTPASPIAWGSATQHPGETHNPCPTRAGSATHTKHPAQSEAAVCTHAGTVGSSSTSSTWGPRIRLRSSRSCGFGVFPIPYYWAG